MDEDSDDREDRGGFGGHGGRGGRGGGGGGGRFGGRGFGPREMHKATCSDCGQECEVPFKPTDGRPVYCRDCYQKHKKF
jgi:CxxC-x17-CxxC domain-containing protein